MPIQFPDFNRISFDEANPYLTGAAKGQEMMQKFLQFPQELQKQILANQIEGVKAKYAEPMAKEGLTKAQQENQWNPKIWQSEIGLRGAQSGQLGAETNKINYLLKHPGFMGGDETKNIEALKQMGLIGDNYQILNNNSPANIDKTNQPQQQPNFNPEQAKQVANAVVKQQQSMGIPQDQVISHANAMQQDASGNTNNNAIDINGLVRAIINKPMADLQYKQTLTNVMRQNLAGKSYTSMPTVEKEYAISQARAFGYTGEQASRMLNQGYDLSSMAKAKGYNAEDPSSWPAARGAPTTAIQTRIQRANSTLAALNAIEPIVSAAYAQYSPRFKNVAPALIKDMISGENPEAQADALAAYALYPEISALRINAMGGNVGEGAIQHIADAAFARLNTLGISPNSYVYQKVQKKVGDLIRKMNRAENASIYGQRNESFEQDDKNQGQSNMDLSHLSDAELQKIAGG